VETMSIEKKSLISTLKTTKKANVASTVAVPDLQATHVASKRPTFKASKRPTFKASKRPTFKASKRMVV